MRKNFFENLPPSALSQGFLNVIAYGGGVEPVAPEDLHVGGLIDEIRLVRNHDAHAPIAVLEGGKSAGTGFVASKFRELLEEKAGSGV